VAALENVYALLRRDHIVTVLVAHRRTLQSVRLGLAGLCK
jgi:hypothetical protein